MSKDEETPGPAVLMLAVSAFILDLVAFCVALSSYPYSAGCDTSGYTGCTTLKAAIGLDGVLWFPAFDLSWLITYPGL